MPDQYFQFACHCYPKYDLDIGHCGQPTIVRQRDVTDTCLPALDEEGIPPRPLSPHIVAVVITTQQTQNHQ